MKNLFLALCLVLSLSAQADEVQKTEMKCGFDGDAVGEMFEDMETLQQIYELKLILNPEIKNNPDLDEDDCLSCGA